ncbi:hypothetical protein POTOM_044251 [Populus tomentosa]|uniref:Uncharacterized protein n=1 Tax=Populus tomentosa TaxID=118781 RepID=A0A8X7YVS1_POPTO|nr:hypothetical protein POTOM_044251 [Populus tomentosa]
MSLELRAYCFFVFSSLVEVYGCGFLLLHFACAGKPSQTLVHGRYHLTLHLIPVNFIALSKCGVFAFFLQSLVLVTSLTLLLSFFLAFRILLNVFAVVATFSRLLLLFAFSTLHQLPFSFPF